MHAEDVTDRLNSAPAASRYDQAIVIQKPGPLSHRGPELGEGMALRGGEYAGAARGRRYAHTRRGGQTPSAAGPFGIFPKQPAWLIMPVALSAAWAALSALERGSRTAEGSEHPFVRLRRVLIALELRLFIERAREQLR